jgi:hypothetical protein
MIKNGYLKIGRVSIRYCSLRFARCMPILCIGGLHFLGRDSGDELILASYHPRGCLTWHWCIGLKKGRPNRFMTFAERRTNQWHDYLRLPFGRYLSIGRQDWHRQSAGFKTA